MKNNWVNSKKEPVKNKDLWIELYNLTNVHFVNFNKVKGHSMLNIIIDVMNLLEMLFLIYKKVVGKYYFPTTFLYLKHCCSCEFIIPIDCKYE